MHYGAPGCPYISRMSWLIEIIIMEMRANPCMYKEQRSQDGWQMSHITTKPPGPKAPRNKENLDPLRPQSTPGASSLVAVG